MSKILVPSAPYSPGPQWGHLSTFEPSTQTLPAGYALPGHPPIPSDIVLHKDVAVKLRDGVTIYVDIFMPPGATNIPVIVAWSPYGKSAGSNPARVGLYRLLGVNTRAYGLEKFEGPDPVYWCSQGYAICHPDARGIALCEGDATLLGRQEGQDCFDVIEWLGAQSWCNGKVGLSGTSYLAAAQWFTAAEQPPHLEAISPTEGFSDIYRDLLMAGGMPDLGFGERLSINFVGKQQHEDYVAEAKRDPYMNDIWRDKAADLGKITVPAYVVASYSNTLHTVGTFRGWRRIASKDKWLRIHNTQEWPDYYSVEATEDLKRFFDCFLRGEENGWRETPRVRYSLLDMHGADQINLPATEFPPAGTVYQSLFLQAMRTFADEPSKDMVAPYPATGWVSWAHRFKTKTSLVGYPKITLWVSADTADDMDIFVELHKLDKCGTHLQQFTVPNQGAMMMDLTERGSSILRYKGAYGRLRASLRELDATATDTIPEHAFDKPRKLGKGEIVKVEIALSPVGLVFEPEEQLRLVISGKSLSGQMMPQIADYVPINEGEQRVHTGVSYPSVLSLPVLPEGHVGS